MSCTQFDLLSTQALKENDKSRTSISSLKQLAAVSSGSNLDKTNAASDSRLVERLKHTEAMHRATNFIAELEAHSLRTATQHAQASYCFSLPCVSPPHGAWKMVGRKHFFLPADHPPRWRMVGRKHFLVLIWVVLYLPPPSDEYCSWPCQAQLIPIYELIAHMQGIHVHTRCCSSS